MIFYTRGKLVISLIWTLFKLILTCLLVYFSKFIATKKYRGYKPIYWYNRTNNRKIVKQCKISSKIIPSIRKHHVRIKSRSYLNANFLLKIIIPSNFSSLIKSSSFVSITPILKLNIGRIFRIKYNLCAKSLQDLIIMASLIDKYAIAITFTFWFSVRIR